MPAAIIDIETKKIDIETKKKTPEGTFRGFFASLKPLTRFECIFYP
jgi:hypothetical protein